MLPCPINFRRPGFGSHAQGWVQVGNAVTEGRRLVLGVGSSEILMAAMWAQANAAMASGASNGMEGRCVLLKSVGQVLS